MELAFSNDECLKLQLPRFSHTNGPPPSLFKILEMLWMVFHPNLTNNSFFVPCSHFFPLHLRRREIRNVNWIRSQALYDAICFNIRNCQLQLRLLPEMLKHTCVYLYLISATNTIYYFLFLLWEYFDMFLQFQMFLFPIRKPNTKIRRTLDISEAHKSEQCAD